MAEYLFEVHLEIVAMKITWQIHKSKVECKQKAKPTTTIAVIMANNNKIYYQ